MDNFFVTTNELTSVAFRKKITDFGAFDYRVCGFGVMKEV